MTVKEIIITWLKDKGYSGLYNYDGECGCVIEDLMPCGSESSYNCEPGYQVECTDKCNHENADEEGWHIQAEKPEERR